MNIDRIAKNVPDLSSSRASSTLLILLLLSAVAISYANAVCGVFILDDYPQVLNNPYIKDWKNIFTVFQSGFGRFNITGANYYRPILESSYFLDHALYGTQALGYHITSILIHMLSTVVLFLLINQLFKNVKISFLTALLFGVHPIYTSAVSYISGRGDALGIMFILSSFLFYIKYLQSEEGGLKFIAPAFFCLLAALFTKETALFCIVILFLFRYCSEGSARKDNSSKWTVIYVLCIAAALIYITARAMALHGLFSTHYNIAAISGGYIRFLTAVKVFLNYFALLAIPIGLHFERTIPLARSFSDPQVLASLLLFGLTVYILIKLRRTKGPVFYGMAWYLLNFIPVSNIFIPLNAYIAENWIQLPAIGVFLAVSAAAVHISGKETDRTFLKICYRSAPLLIIGLAAAYSLLTIYRNSEYRDPVLFYERALQYEPKSSKLYNNLGLEIESRRRDIGKAIVLYKKAMENDPANTNAMNNLANAYSAQGRFDDAIALYKKGLEISRDNTFLLNNLGVAYIRKGDKDSALYYWRASLKINPGQPVIRQYIDRNPQ